MKKWQPNACLENLKLHVCHCVSVYNYASLGERPSCWREWCCLVEGQFFLAAKRLQLIASTINWQFSWQRFYAPVRDHPAGEGGVDWQIEGPTVVSREGCEGFTASGPASQPTSKSLQTLTHTIVEGWTIYVSKTSSQYFDFQLQTQAKKVSQTVGAGWAVNLATQLQKSCTSPLHRFSPQHPSGSGILCARLKAFSLKIVPLHFSKSSLRTQSGKSVSQT